MKYWKSILENIIIEEEDGALTGLYIRTQKMEGRSKRKTPLIRNTSRQVREYLQGERKTFTLPLSPGCTASGDIEHLESEVFTEEIESERIMKNNGQRA